MTSVAAAEAKPESSAGSSWQRAEEPTQPPYSAMYASIGLGGTGLGFAGRAQITGAYQHWFAGGLLGYTKDFEILGATPLPSLLEVGALTGYHVDFGSFILSAGAGIAWVSSVTRGALLEPAGDHWSDRYAEVSNTGFGVPFALHAIYHGETFGVGAQLFGNYNADLPVLGAAATVHVGEF